MLWLDISIYMEIVGLGIHMHVRTFECKKRACCLRGFLFSSFVFLLDSILHVFVFVFANHAYNNTKVCAWLPVCHLQSPPELRWPPWMAYEEPCIFHVLHIHGIYI